MKPIESFKKLGLVTKLTIMIICFSSLTIIITAALFSTYFEYTLVRTISNSEIKNLNRVTDNYENMNSTAKTMLLNFNYDTQMQKILNMDKVDRLQLTLNMNKISTYYSHTPYLYSYYLINYKNNYVFSNIDTVTFGEFFDQEILRILSNDKTIEKFTPIYRQIPAYNQNESQNVFTYIFFEKYNEVIDSKAIVVNISEKYLLDFINSITENGEVISIYNRTGQLVLSSKTSGESEYLINKTKTDDKQSGYYIDHFNNNKYLICFNKDNENNLQIVKYIPYQTVNKYINNVRFTAILLGIILLCIALSIAAYSTNKLSKPINNLYEKIQLLEKEKHKEIPRIRALLLELILRNNDIDDISSIKEKFEVYNININIETDIFIGLCKVDNFKKFEELYDLKSSNSIRSAMINIANEVFKGIAKVDGTSIESGSVLLIFSEFDISIQQNELKLLFEKLMEIVEKKFDFTFTIALSHRKAFENIHELYNTSNDIINYRFLLGHKSILFPSQITENEENDYEYPSDLEYNINKFILNEDWEKVEKYVRNLLKDLYKCSFNNAKYAIFRLTYSIQITISTLKLKNNIEITDTLNLEKTLLECETLDDTIIYFENIFQNMKTTSFQNVNEMQEKYSKVIDEVCIYIKENYSDYNLSLDSISEKFIMSPITLGRSFRKIKGTPVFNYITDVRINNAEYFLTTTDMTTKEIAEVCGFANSSYFFTIFRKYYNTTPREYKKRKMKNDNITENNVL